MKLDGETKASSNGKQVESSTRQVTLYRHCNVKVKPEQVIRARFGRVIGDYAEIFLCDHFTPCEPCYDGLMGVVNEYVGICNETCGGAKMTTKELKEITIGSNIPFIKAEGKWVVSEKQEEAAWELYVELITRISVVELKPGEGFLREALTSLYSLFGITREILRRYGPVVARPQDDGKYTFGYLAVTILNLVLRPVTAKWHPLLRDYEHAREEDVSELEHENRWERAQELRDTLNETRQVLITYANLLADAAEVPLLIVDR